MARNHLILIRDAHCRYCFGSDRVLIPASAVLRQGARLDMTARVVTSGHIMCDRHVILRANGTPAETFLPGPQAMAALTPMQRQTLVRHPRGPELARDMIAATQVPSRIEGGFLLSQILTPGAERNAG